MTNRFMIWKQNKLTWLIRPLFYAAFLRRANTTLEKVIADMNQLMEKLVVMALNYCSDEVVPEGEQLLHDQIIQSNKDVCIKLNEVATVTSILLEKISSITIQDTDETPDPE
ncbi:Hypothetical predicted protein [Cloeon dipterum]|uniref:Uncharacterized protein n=1 Tax=Cloeon dipterum TaxID=197152 RepID=A0A8S1BYV2_9INSE|nr:Hypothetical predicted protein [Cloeon dipterum]